MDPAEKEETRNMHCILVWLTAKDASNIPQIRGLLGEAGRLSRAEPGCLRFDVYHSENDATRFLLCEHWETKADWEAHRTGQAYTEIYQPQVLPLVTREPHISALVT
jgi:quinol monooxygenase YgiN